MIYSALRRVLFRFDAEAAHELATSHVDRLQKIPAAIGMIRRLCAPPPALSRKLWGLDFSSPLGIAAGFDKNASMIPFLSALGFGFVEVGTVTLHPQPGNPKPRMFRYPAARALVNRLGFNNEGADAVSERMRQHSATVPLFVNVGKNRDVPIDRAGEAYADCYMRVARWADGCVLNLSSPNTPSLRDLQKPEHLEKLLTLVRAVREELTFARSGSHPILVKIAPDLDAGQLREICEVTKRLAEGMVCTNTTTAEVIPGRESGGLSGAPLFAPSTAVLREVRKNVGDDYPLIGTGGIFTVDDARAKLEAGADLVQVYTGFVYEGPGMPSRLARQLVKDMGSATFGKAPVDS
jgi:dihydroorotate dehydrogenase